MIMQMRRVNTEEELKAPGDYLVVTCCGDCGAQGEMIAPKDGGQMKYHYEACRQPQIATAVIAVCKCGNQFSVSPKVHRIDSVDPLTLNPSWLCPKGCHSFITNGVWHSC